MTQQCLEGKGIVGARHPSYLREHERMGFLLATRAAQQFIEQMPIAIAIFDGEMRYRAVSRRHLSDLAWLFSTEVLSADKIIGRRFRDVSPNMPPRWGDAHDRVLAGEELSHYEDFVLRQDGRPVWVRWIMKPWRNVHGRIDGALLFSELVTEEVEIRHALHESEARARATFENAAVGISHITRDGRFLRFNKALSRILGWPADELITKTVREITHPEDLAAELTQLKELEDGKVDSNSLDQRNLRKDGSIVWLRRTVSCVRRSDGSIDYFVSVVEDISSRRQAEEQVDLLMREARHRTKNILGLVQVIARQTATGDAQDFIDRFTERIRALAANQDLLVRHEWRRIDVKDLVHVQLGHFADLIGTRINFNGPKLDLNAAAAQAIGLALHELATNASKYGATSTDAGRVDVSWESKGDVFTISWTERDGPPVQPPKRRGFGSTVIDAMAKLATDGEVQLDYAPSGLAWRLKCPAAKALEAPI
jgi:PAS domain S-box-containing protein